MRAKWSLVKQLALVSCSFASLSCLEHDTIQARVATPPGVGASKDTQWIANPRQYITEPYQLNPNLRVPILCYHEVKYVPGNELTLKPGQFESEMAWLHKNHFHTINFGQLYAATFFKYKLPTKPVILTFDDGYESVYTDVYPVLRQYGYQATVFVITGAVQNKHNHRGKYPIMTVRELQALSHSGLLDIESHTVHHWDLTHLSPSQIDAEFQESNQDIRAWTHHPALFLCYPSGRYNKTAQSIARKDGYLLATTQRYGVASVYVQGPLNLYRIPIHQSDTLSRFKNSMYVPG